VEAAPTTDAAEFQPVGPVTSERALTIPLTDETAFYRVRLLP
jgi:hypothetical protein